MSHLNGDTPDLTTGPAPMQPIKRSWWSRHWKWVIPVGCLTPVVGCLGFITLLVAIIFGSLKSSHAYQDSLTTLKADPRVTAVLGSPIEPDFLITGQINVNTSGGNANLQYNVTGPNDSAAVHVTAIKSAGQWTYTRFEVQPASTGQTIDMLASP